MEPFALIIFGITGNLAQIKLIPALYDLEEKDLIPEGTRIFGIARRDWDRDQYLKYISETILFQNKSHHHETDAKVLELLLKRMNYLQGDFEAADSDKLYERLKKILKASGSICTNRLFYLATYPDLYASIFSSLERYGLNKDDCGWVRIMIEKPLGHDLDSAKKLDNLLHEFYKEEQIYRLDHYLGKETIQNILVFRFGNSLIQPMMNRDYVDHIQITSAEDFGIGTRGGYYDNMGALKDVGQNHLLQMLVVATMDQPGDFSNIPVTGERIKILQNLVPDPSKLVLGQYNGYLYEEKVKPQSTSDTFFAFKTEIKTDNWYGVPIYIRAGKKLSQSVSEISIVFKPYREHLFKHLELGSRPNVLTYRIQPNEGIGLELLTKRPGYKLALDSDYMQFCYRTKKNEAPDAYEKLLFDAISGDPTFFNDTSEVEAAWKFIDEMNKEKIRPFIYEPGSWGPSEANELIEADGRHWLEPSPILCSI